MWYGAGRGSLHPHAVAFGLSALLLTSALAFSMVKYLGATYLIYLRVCTLLAHERKSFPFWIEGVALGVLSWVIGYLLSIPLSRSVLNQFSTLVPIPLLFNPYALVETLLALLVVVTLASVIPVRLANRLRVADALRYE